MYCEKPYVLIDYDICMYAFYTERSLTKTVTHENSYENKGQHYRLTTSPRTWYDQ